MKTTRLNIGLPLWGRLVGELKRRGSGVRESGAFLLGGMDDSSMVTHFIAYDDLDPSALDSGIVVFQGAGYVTLWNFCAQKKMRVLADVHTHEGIGTGQSETDRTNPMVELPGHIALIVPNFAGGNSSTLKGVGIYEYLGDHEWHAWNPESGKVKITHS
jgi:proteasome lid subunit RPN8/RPN11